jgi:hypothetical protein
MEIALLRRVSVLATVLAAALIAASVGPSAPFAGDRADHLLDMARAKAAVEDLALRRTHSFTTHWTYVVTDGQPLRFEINVDCRRTGDHSARCPWRSLVYVGDAPDAVLACTLVYRVLLQGSRLRLLYSYPGGAMCFQ